MLYRQIVQKAELEADNEILEKQILIQKEHYTALQENQKQLKEIKQDLLEKMNVSHPEVFTDEQSTRAYINELISKSDKLNDLEFCQNKIVDAILYNKFLIAKSSDIQTRSEVILPEQLEIDALDLMRLLTNLLDNAIEACGKLEENKRFLSISGQVRAGFVIFKIENSKPANQVIDFDHPQTTKADKSQHGLGISIIKDVINHYHGNYSIDNETDKVTINITLQNQAN